MAMSGPPDGAAGASGGPRAGRWATSGARSRARPLFEREIVRRAIGDSFRKLDPRVQLRNPVMFVVLVGAAVTTVEFVRSPAGQQPRRRPRLHPADRHLALVHRALRQLRRGDGRGARQGPGRHPAQDPHRRPGQATATPAAPIQTVSATELRRGDLVLVEAGDLIPGDGEVVEGVASVNEAAITGESAPVIKEPGTDIRSSRHRRHHHRQRPPEDPDHRQSGRDLHRPDDRPGGGRQPPEDAQRDRPEHPAGLADDHLPAGGLHPAALRHLLGRRGGGDHPGRAAGLPDPHHHRRPALAPSASPAWTAWCSSTCWR